MLLYIHIPFCDSKCHYCAFNSYTYLHHLKKDYINSLKKQLIFELEKQNKQIETIFIGGGTPSTIESQYFAEILDIVKPYFLTDDIEITIEANPNSATLKWLEGIYKTPINRVSFGVQSFDDEKLKFLGRNHISKQAIKAIKDSFNIGFKHINIDIIYDTSLDTKELLQKDFAIIKQLPIDHISCYSLTIEEKTKFYNTPQYKVENIKLANYIFTELNNLGFTQYEISNFAKKTSSRSRHNLGYWQYKEYLGVGSGAVVMIDYKRYYTFTDVQQYIKNSTNYEEIENLSSKDILTEKILLGFRSDVGVDLDILSKDQLKKIQILKDEKKIYIKDNIAFNYDFLLSDELALYLSP